MPKFLEPPDLIPSSFDIENFYRSREKHADEFKKDTFSSSTHTFKQSKINPFHRFRVLKPPLRSQTSLHLFILQPPKLKKLTFLAALLLKYLLKMIKLTKNMKIKRISWTKTTTKMKRIGLKMMLKPMLQVKLQTNCSSSAVVKFFPRT